MKKLAVIIFCLLSTSTYLFIYNIYPTKTIVQVNLKEIEIQVKNCTPSNFDDYISQHSLYRNRLKRFKFMGDAFRANSSVYIRIPKASSTLIIKTLYYVRHCNIHLVHPRQHCRHNPNVTIFTFVREPLERFASGIGTVFQRNCMITGDRDFRVILKHVLDQIEAPPMIMENCRGRLDLRDPEEVLLHLIPMTLLAVDPEGIPIKFDFIGKVENIKEDWNKLMKLNPTIPPMELDRLNVKEGGNTSQMFMEWLSENRDLDLVKRLCKYLENDYSCFDYEIHPICNF